MVRSLSRFIKRIFVALGVDTLCAYLYSKTEWAPLCKLIPDRTYYNSDAVRVVSRYGVRFKLRLADFSQWQIFSKTNFDHVDAALTILKGKTSGVILDIGANCGHFSLVISRIIDTSDWNFRIVVFEPNPRVFGYLKENISLNSGLEERLTLVNEGVGVDKSSMELQIPLRNTGAGSLMRNYVHEPHERYTVPINSIDSRFLESNDDVVFMKIDVENFEYPVLVGAAGTINRCKPAIYLEISGKDEDSRSDIVGFLLSNGYILFTERHGDYVKLDEEMRSTFHGITDLLAIWGRSVSR